MSYQAYLAFCRYTEHKYQGLDSAGQAILDVQTGANTAKAVIIVSEE
jgi:hypothetical protein